MASSHRSGRACWADRSVRNLVNPEARASTARAQPDCGSANYGGKLRSTRTTGSSAIKTLNRSIIVKHRLRPNEGHVLHDGHAGGTKINLPIDVTDLRSGARSFFIDQTGFRGPG